MSNQLRLNTVRNERRDAIQRARRTIRAIGEGGEGEEEGEGRLIIKWSMKKTWGAGRPARNRDKRRQIPPLRRTRSLEVGRRMQEIGTWFVSARMVVMHMVKRVVRYFSWSNVKNSSPRRKTGEERELERIFVNEEIVRRQRSVIIGNIVFRRVSIFFASFLLFYQILTKWNFSFGKINSTLLDYRSIQKIRYRLKNRKF